MLLSLAKYLLGEQLYHLLQINSSSYYYIDYAFLVIN